MTTETIFALVALVLVIGVIIDILLNARPGQSVIQQRLPLATMLEGVKAELLLADRKAKEQGSALLKFEECEFEFAIETQVDAAGRVTVYALQLGAGAQQIESNKIRVKYVSLPDQDLEGAIPASD
jgi:hypothetical protein